ncbi:hypothetical protein R1sor_004398 [Riccia sorocarpa]|uniref:Uncharacterized protein n=1 Tax=Riccia sorocarpa TaxID=122646 RepID=A0ABD3HK37_9MARC
MPRDKIAKSRGGIVAFDDSPVSHNTRLGVAKKQTFNQFLSGIESPKDDNSMAEADDSMTRSRREGESPQIETSEGPVQSGANSLQQGELVREKGIVRTNLLAMSEVGQSSQVAPSPEGSNSAGRDQQISVFEEVSDRDRVPAESPKSGGVLRLVQSYLLRR